MNKENFLNKLRKRLDILQDSEIEDIISEYETYIDEKVAGGKTEEEAVKELGNFNEIVDDLLSAYKVKSKSDDNKYNVNNINVNNIINKIGDTIVRVLNSLSQKSPRELVKILIEIVIILLIVGIFKIPFNLIRDLGTELFFNFGSLGIVLDNIKRFIIELSYFILAVIIIIKVFNKRYFSNLSDEIVENIESNNKEDKQNVKKKPEIISEKANNPKRHSLFVEIILILFKLLAVSFIIVGMCAIFGLSVAICLMIYLIANGVSYYGILIFLIALLLGSIFFTNLITKFIFNKHISGVAVISQIITIIFLAAIGSSMIAIEFANTEIIIDQKNINTKSVTETIPITDNLKIYNYDRYVIDNTLTDSVKIEYIYPDFGNDINIDIDIRKYNSHYYLRSSLKNFKIKDLLSFIIENLKDKKIYVNDFMVEKVIYISENNYQKLINKSASVEYISKKYKVINFAKDNHKVSLTLQDDKKETETVQITKYLDYNYKVNKSYQFNFKCLNHSSSNLSHLFNNCELESITQ